MKKIIFTILMLLFITSSAYAQKEHFGLILGEYYNVEAISRDFRSHYGSNADYGGTGSFYQIRIYSNCNKDGATFGSCTIDFYNGRFWKICYNNIKNDPNEFAKKLEWKFMDYSTSTTKYTYQYRDIFFEFDGNRLRYVDEGVSRSILY